MDPRVQQALNDAYQQGRLQGRQEAALNSDAGFRTEIEGVRREFEAKINRMAGGIRKQLTDAERHMATKLGEASAVLGAVEMDRSGGGVPQVSYRDEGNIVRPQNIRIQDIPGRRVPFVFLVDIFIENNTTTVRTGSFTVSQEGPFVAVKRMAIFQSALQFETTDPNDGSTATFPGRSFGRYRPIHSAWDILDSQHNGITENANWWLTRAATLAAGLGPGTTLPSAGLALPTNMSSFRTMEFDGRIEIENAGSSYPRQNKPIPSAWWSSSINAPWDLGCLDFFERGEVVTFKVDPSHINNPPAGNVGSACIFPNTTNGGNGWPFVDGQYDAHEGICTPQAVTVGTADPLQVNVISTDPVQRLPDGILTLAFEGYRIQQPIGPAA